MRAAMEKLDLMVSVDLYRNVSAEMADYVLPGTDFLERSDINLTHPVVCSQHRTSCIPTLSRVP